VAAGLAKLLLAALALVAARHMMRALLHSGEPALVRRVDDTNVRCRSQLAGNRSDLRRQGDHSRPLVAQTETRGRGWIAHRYEARLESDLSLNPARARHGLIGSTSTIAACV
jgi:hypothetical protein